MKKNLKFLLILFFFFTQIIYIYFLNKQIHIKVINICPNIYPNICIDDKQLYEYLINNLYVYINFFFTNVLLSIFYYIRCNKNCCNVQNKECDNNFLEEKYFIIYFYIFCLFIKSIFYFIGIHFWNFYINKHIFIVMMSLYFLINIFYCNIFLFFLIRNKKNYFLVCIFYMLQKFLDFVYIYYSFNLIYPLILFNNFFIQISTKIFIYAFVCIDLINNFFIYVLSLEQ